MAHLTITRTDEDKSDFFWNTQLSPHPISRSFCVLNISIVVSFFQCVYGLSKLDDRLTISDLDPLLEKKVRYVCPTNYTVKVTSTSQEVSTSVQPRIVSSWTGQKIKPSDRVRLYSPWTYWKYNNKLVGSKNFPPVQGDLTLVEGCLEACS